MTPAFPLNADSLIQLLQFVWPAFVIPVMVWAVKYKAKPHVPLYVWNLLPMVFGFVADLLMRMADASSHVVAAVMLGLLATGFRELIEKVFGGGGESGKSIL